MKMIFPSRQLRARIELNKERTYYTVICLASLALSSGVSAQTNPLSSGSTNVTTLPPVTVFGRLEEAREQIVPSLGATSYGINSEQIQDIPQGANAPFNQVLLRAPGMAEDSLGQLHIRGEHANLQYRINDVLLPEGITGFGNEIDTRFVNELHVVTGSLPAQYGFRTAGIVDIHTKNGAFTNGGELSLYGGSFETIRPSLEYGGSKGNLNYFADFSFNHNNIGIENPTSSHDAIHDITDQYKGFLYLSYILDDTSRISLIGSASHSDFELPNTPGLAPGTSPDGSNWSQFTGITNFDSTELNERQNEQNYYVVGAYQKSAGDLNLQVAAFGRNSSVHFLPDPVGDLFFDGVASDVDREIWAGGLQADASYALGDKHTIRGGLFALDEVAPTHSTVTVFGTDTGGNPTNAPFSITDNTVSHALFLGAYLQDEWKILPKVTLNYGARFDVYWSSADHENQPSPRVNLIYQPTEATALHAGYARYFTPPPLENVPATSVRKFDNTSNASATDQDDPVKAERAHYFDVGISQKLAPGLQAGVDGYYKTARNQLDDGFFGQSLIPSAFNYRFGQIYGIEFTTSYVHEGFSAYANVAYSVARGQEWTSAQFLFDPGDANYVRNHWIHLDHDQKVSGSFGASYLWKRSDGSTRIFADALYGSGLRTDATAADGSTIPNGGTVPSYYSVGFGIEEAIKFHGKEHFKARLDVANLTDNIYQLRNGGGVGVNAAQFGTRLGFFGSICYVF